VAVAVANYRKDAETRAQRADEERVRAEERVKKEEQMRELAEQRAKAEQQAREHAEKARQLAEEKEKEAKENIIKERRARKWMLHADRAGLCSSGAVVAGLLGWQREAWLASEQDRLVAVKMREEENARPHRLGLRSRDGRRPEHGRTGDRRGTTGRRLGRTGGDAARPDRPAPRQTRKR
jgi:hypothetical protein